MMDVKKTLEIAEEDFRETGQKLFKRHPELKDEVLSLTAIAAGMEIMKVISGDVSSFKELQEECNFDVEPKVISDLADILYPQSGHIFIGIKPENDGTATMRCFYSCDHEIAERVLKEALERIEAKK